jgi:hypothetical protein
LNNSPKLYLDLDGVFADFNGRAIELVGQNQREIDKKIFWKELGKVEYFYFSLNPLPDSIDHFHLITKCVKRPIEILTGLPLLLGNFKTSVNDKQEWVKKYLSSDIICNCVASAKRDKIKFITSEYDCLIDDSITNIELWNSAGGIGILHTDWSTTMCELKANYII